MRILNEKPMLKKFHYTIKRQLYGIIVKLHHCKAIQLSKKVMKIESLLSSILFEGISSINRDWVIINNEWLQQSTKFHFHRAIEDQNILINK